MLRQVFKKKHEVEKSAGLHAESKGKKTVSERGRDRSVGRKKEEKIYPLP